MLSGIQMQALDVVQKQEDEHTLDSELQTLLLNVTVNVLFMSCE